MPTVTASNPTLSSDARRVSLIVASAFFMQNLDTAILQTSLPQMAADFAVAPVDLNIGITAYVLSTAAFVPLSGWAADHFGAKRVFALAVVVFTAASLACALSHTLLQFTLMRAFQGMGGALMAPVGRMVVLRSAEKADLLRATALITWPALIGPVVGPVLGGLITTYASWHWNFLLNVPVGVVGLGFVLAFIPDHRAPGSTPLDWLGFALSAAGLVCLLHGLEALAQAGASWRFALLYLLAGIGVGSASVLHFRRSLHPLLDLSPITTPSFAIASVDAGSLFRIAISATPFLLPLLFQVAFGLSPFASGLLLLAYFAGNLAMKTVTTPTLQRFGFRNVLLGNGIAVALSLALCAMLKPDTPWLVCAAVLFLAGLTRSMHFTTLNTLAFAEIVPAQRGSASTLSSMFQQVGMALGTAFAAFLLNASQALRGAAELGLGDFRVAFVAIGGIALLGTALALRLAPEAGAEVSGHQPRRA